MDSSSSSCSSGLSYHSPSSREPTPEFNVAAMYEAIAPQWWDEADWDFDVWSEDDESLTDGEDNLQFLVDGELEEESDDMFSWGEDISSDEEDKPEDDSSDEYPPTKRFRAGLEDDDDDEEDEEEAPAEGFTSSDEDTAGSSADGSEDGGDDGSDGSNGAGF